MMNHDQEFRDAMKNIFYDDANEQKSDWPRDLENTDLNHNDVDKDKAITLPTISDFEASTQQSSFFSRSSSPPSLSSSFRILPPISKQQEKVGG